MPFPTLRGPAGIATDSLFTLDFDRACIAQGRGSVAVPTSAHRYIVGNILIADGTARTIREVSAANAVAGVTAIAPWPAQPGLIRFKFISGTDQGTGAQNGMRKLRVTGWNERFEQVTKEYLTYTNGSLYEFNDPDASGLLWWAIDSVEIIEAGSLESNAGDLMINLHTGSANITTGGIRYIGAGQNADRSAVWQIPPTHYGLLSSVSVTSGVTSNSSWRIDLMHRKAAFTKDAVTGVWSLSAAGALVSNNPSKNLFYPLRSAFFSDTSSSTTQLMTYDDPVRLAPGSQIAIRVQRLTGAGTGSFSVNGHIHLIQKDILDA